MENTTPHSPLLFEAAADILSDTFRRNRVPLISSFVFGLLAYTFAFTNKLINHDETYNLFGKGATVDSGRWGLSVMDSLFPNYSMPWIYGIITIAFIAIASAFMVRILQVRSKPLQVLLAGCVTVFPSLIGTLAFMYTSTSYALAFLLAVIAVWFFQKDDWKFWIPGIGCLVFSVSIYQAYISVAAGLLVLVLIRRLLLEEDVKPVLKRGFLYVGFLGISLVLYYVGVHVVLFITGRELNQYATERISFSPAALLENAILAYRSFFLFFTDKAHSLIPTDYSVTIHCLGLAAAAFLLLLWGTGQKKRSLPRLLLLLFLLAIFPLAINCMYLFTPASGIHTLVLYGFIGIYLLMIVVCDVCIPLYLSGKRPEWLRRTLINVVVLCLTLIIVVNTYIANASFLSLHLQYETMYGFYTSLIADIKMMPEFNKKTKIAIVGSWKHPSYYGQQFDFAHTLYGLYDSAPDIYSKEWFVEYYLGLDLKFATPAEIRAIRETEEFQEMKRYPYYGSMRMIDNYLVVRLSK